MRRKIFVGILVAVLGFVTLLSLSHLMDFENKNMIWGTTFNAEYARYLGLDDHAVLRTIVGDWGFKYIRLSAQWDNIETNKGVYDFTDIDWQMNMAQDYGAKAVLAIGQKTPRWPECHLPAWTVDLGTSEYQYALDGYIQKTVEHFKNHPALEIWQVENEPFLDFGGANCRAISGSQLDDEILLVRNNDVNHKILVSDSGELSSWRRTALAGDLFGTTMYRVVWNKYIGYWNYDWVPPIFYIAKLWLNQKPAAGAYIMELQGEPWIPNSTVMETAISEQARSMDLPRLKKNMNFAIRVGWPRAYLWGAEWWYWLDKQGVSEIADFIKTVKKN